ncbi:hypothetical protein ACEN8I_01840 [Polaromonas sp. CT11-55]|uniref:hypothetical protein n=1 Tax=Polaromonas sp. CT11-55 TaxID=3243045 RepID=UPI0039A54D81
MTRGPAFITTALGRLGRLGRLGGGAGLAPLRALGWPVLCGIGLLLVGALLLGLSQQLRLQKNKLQLELRQAQKPSPKAAASAVRGVPVIFPPASDYTADLAQIFDIAKSQGIVLASGDYRDADPTALGLDTRLVDLRINENYGTLKEFLASVLNAMPHAAVQELRIERKDGTTVKHQVFLKLALVYSPRAAQAPGTQPMAGRIPASAPEPSGTKGMP